MLHAVMSTKSKFLSLSIGRVYIFASIAIKSIGQGLYGAAQYTIVLQY